MNNNCPIFYSVSSWGGWVLVTKFVMPAPNPCTFLSKIYLPFSWRSLSDASWSIKFESRSKSCSWYIRHSIVASEFSKYSRFFIEATTIPCSNTKERRDWPKAHADHEPKSPAPTCMGTCCSLRIRPSNRKVWTCWTDLQCLAVQSTERWKSQSIYPVPVWFHCE